MDSSRAEQESFFQKIQNEILKNKADLGGMNQAPIKTKGIVS